MKHLAQEKVKQGAGGKLFNFRPALFFALFFALGVWSVYRFQTDGNFLFTVGVSLLLIPLVLLLSNKKSARRIAIDTASVFCFIAGGWCS